MAVLRGGQIDRNHEEGRCSWAKPGRGGGLRAMEHAQVVRPHAVKGTIFMRENSLISKNTGILKQPDLSLPALLAIQNKDRC